MLFLCFFVFQIEEPYTVTRSCKWAGYKSQKDLIEEWIWSYFGKLKGKEKQVNCLLFKWMFEWPRIDSISTPFTRMSPALLRAAFAFLNRLSYSSVNAGRHEETGCRGEMRKPSSQLSPKSRCLDCGVQNPVFEDAKCWINITKTGLSSSALEAESE